MIASATINAALFQNYFGGPERVALLQFKGLKQHRIDAFFPFYDFPLKNDRQVASRMADKAVELLYAIAEGEKSEGDILGFLDGAGSIDTCVGLLRERISAQPPLQDRGINVYPLHTKLGLEEQDKALAPKTRTTRDRVLALMSRTGSPPDRIAALLLDQRAAEETGRLLQAALDEKGDTRWTVTVPPPEHTGVDRWPRQVICTTHERFRDIKADGPFDLVCDRRVVISTNLAETSLTVDGVVYVIDSGLIKESRWDPRCSASELVPIFHSRAGCRQRWGRAGRVRSGEAHMLYTDAQFEDEKGVPGPHRA